MSLTDSRPLLERERQILYDLARASIEQGLHGEAPQVDVENFSSALQESRATFITLHVNSELHGCIGSLKAYRALVLDVAENAYAAAFCDPRFARLTESEFLSLDVHISILSPTEPMHFSTEDELLQQIRPGIDGLILTEHGYCGTFLPTVWDILPEPHLFLRNLKQKAGLSPDYWSNTLAVVRYTVESIP